MKTGQRLIQVVYQGLYYGINLHYNPLLMIMKTNLILKLKIKYNDYKWKIKKLFKINI